MTAKEYLESQGLIFGDDVFESDDYEHTIHWKEIFKMMDDFAALSPAKQEQPDHTIILSKLERTFGHLDNIFKTLQEAHPHNTKALLDGIDIDFKDIQEQIKKALYK